MLNDFSVMKVMRKLFLVFIVMAFSSIASAVNVTISYGLENESLKNKMARAMSSLLTEVNEAQASNRALNFNKLRYSERVQISMSMLWENSPFMCPDDELVLSCVRTGSGFQFRNIPLMMRPRNAKNFNEEEYQEGVVSFSPSGDVESFYLTIDNNLYAKIIKENLELTDLRRRQLILDYVEHFRTSYNQKDLNFLKQVFSDDALILTGKVIKQQRMDGIPMPDKIVITKQTKQEYLSKLKTIFAANKSIKVTFDEIKVVRHPIRPNFYGVTLHQGYSSDRYHDDGYVFLLWDFTDENAPKIHVRTWQPDQINNGRLPEDEVFNLNDFDI